MASIVATIAALFHHHSARYPLTVTVMSADGSTIQREIK
jgi:hypothetical protein